MEKKKKDFLPLSIETCVVFLFFCFFVETWLSLVEPQAIRIKQHNTHHGNEWFQFECLSQSISLLSKPHTYIQRQRPHITKMEQTIC
mmetsp:Transcript_18326/g.29039  ORF Transcript_18326/g.29039 Transcript_18326/m.29039 type:complete len:87 (+) Transcript_18326:555-815(+)